MSHQKLEGICMLAENVKPEEIEALQKKLQDLKQQEGIIGYILRGPQTAAIDLKDPTKIIEYASLSSTALEESNDIAKTLEIGELDNLIVETEKTKLLSMNINDHRISIFMEKSFDHKKLCNDLK